MSGSPTATLALPPNQSAAAESLMLIQREIEFDPSKPGPADARLIASGISIWAIVGHLLAVAGDAEQAAADYELSAEAMAAALAYLRRHRFVIEARLSANAGGEPVDTSLIVG